MERSQRLKELLKEKILVLDGAMGTALQSAGLSAQDFGGEAFEGCNEVLNLTRPDVVEAIHRGYLEAGADIIETNTFGSTAVVLAEYPPLNESLRDHPAGSRDRPPDGRPNTAPPKNPALWPARWGRRPRPSPSPAASPLRIWSRPTRNRPGASSMGASITSSSKRRRTPATSRRP